jgi:signal transduction histidine kinase
MLNLYDIIVYPLFAIAASETALGVIFFVRRRRGGNVYKSIAAFSFFVAAFALATALAYLQASRGMNFQHYYRATWIGWLALPALLQFLLYLDDPQSRTARIIGYVLYPIWSILLLLCLFTDLVEIDHRTLIPFHRSGTGPLENPARFFGAFLALWGIYEAYRLKEKAAGIKKIQLSYNYYGILILGGAGGFLAGLAQLFGGFGLDPALISYFGLPWLALIIYSITRHRFLDMRIVVSQTLGFAFLFIIGATLHMVLFKLLEPALGPEYALVASLLVIGVIFFGTPFSRKIQNGISNVVAKNKYDYQKTLKESIKALITILDLKKLLCSIVQNTRTILGTGRVVLLLKDGQGFYPARIDAPDDKAEQFCQRIDKGFIIWIERKKQAVTRAEMEIWSSNGNESNRTGFTDDIDTELIVPLMFNGKLEGLLILGRKEDTKPYDSSDIDLLEALAGHAAVAIENARLHEESIRQYQARLEQERRYVAEKEKIIKSLHDGIGSTMTSIGSLAELALRAHGDKDVSDKLAAIADLSRNGISDTREFMSILEDREATWEGLIADFTHQGCTIIESQGMSFEVVSSINDDSRQPDSLLGMNLYLIYKEALTNIIKHAKAHAVKVDIRVGADKFVLSVTDDGVGSVHKRNGGRGLVNMQARAADVRGTLTITSDHGTCVHVEVPLKVNVSQP